MHILITGNMGYVGPGVIRQLRSTYPEAILTGFDAGYFSSCLTGADYLPEQFLNKQHFGDMRTIKDELLEGVDAIVHLAAISNDPMGHAYEQVTMDVNYYATIRLAEKAKVAGVKRFVFASSCSVYGYADDGLCHEGSTLDPLSAYAKSKALSEEGLRQLAGSEFTVSCLRFPTA